MEKKFVPEIMGELRSTPWRCPRSSPQCSGIRIFGIGSSRWCLHRRGHHPQHQRRRGDRGLSLHPQPAITQALMTLSEKLVFAGWAAGSPPATVVSLAIQAEYQGAMGVVVNAPPRTRPCRCPARGGHPHCGDRGIGERGHPGPAGRRGQHPQRVRAGKTARIVAAIREKLPTVAILATGGPTEATIAETIQAGANAISYTPPTSAELFKSSWKPTARKRSEATCSWTPSKHWFLTWPKRPDSPRAKSITPPPTASPSTSARGRSRTTPWRTSRACPSGACTRALGYAATEVFRSRPPASWWTPPWQRPGHRGRRRAGDLCRQRDLRPG